MGVESAEQPTRMGLFLQPDGYAEILSHPNDSIPSSGHRRAAAPIALGYAASR
jgi:hypothetical protein